MTVTETAVAATHRKRIRGRNGIARKTRTSRDEAEEHRESPVMRDTSIAATD